MKFGVGVPTCRQGMDVPPDFCSPQELIEISQLADNLGLDFVWGSDFATPIPAMRERFGARNLNWYEIVVSMACIAMSTKRVGLGFGVIVLPFRDPVMLAKEIATLDSFSNGRVLFGVGLGGIRQEFEMLYPAKAKNNRGVMLDEGIQVMRRLFDDEEASFEGQYYSFDKVAFHPKPVQKPLPIHVAGRAAETLRRIAKYGDGWVVGPYTTVNVLEEKIERLESLAAEQKRNISEFSIFCDAALSVAKTHEDAVERFKSSFVGARRIRGTSLEEVLPLEWVGTPEEIAEKITERKNVGATHIVAQHIAGDDFSQLREQVQMFAEEVIPLC